MTAKKILISINSSWNIVNFRAGLVASLQEMGYSVHALSPTDNYSDRLERVGVKHHPIEIDSKGVSPLTDLVLLWRYFRALRRLRPDIFLGYTAKPNIYGSIAARALGIPSINNVSGLGTAFIRLGVLAKIVEMLYRLAFRRSATVFFQNADDINHFVAARIVTGAQARLLPGSGINLSAFSPAAASSDGNGITFLLIARLLRDKGISEYVSAARLLRPKLPAARFQLLGFLDAANRTAIGKEEVGAWVKEGVVEYLGASADVRPHIAAADCIVLPSYREGLPRVLLEGAAMGKPLIATDVPGCRDVIEQGRTGFLCAVRDEQSLAEAMARIAELTPSERREMGAAGREKVEAEFDEQRVVRSYVAAIEAALRKSS